MNVGRQFYVFIYSRSALRYLSARLEPTCSCPKKVRTIVLHHVLQTPSATVGVIHVIVVCFFLCLLRQEDGQIPEVG